MNESIENKQDTQAKLATQAKPAKPPSKRKLFYDEMRGKIQAQFPGLKLAQTNQKLFELWKIHLDEEFAFKPMGLYK